MAEGPALEALRRPRLGELRRLEEEVAGLRKSGDYRGPPCPEHPESLTVCRDRIDLRRLALDESRDAALTRGAAERSPGVFGWLRSAARLTMLPVRLGRGIRARMEEWAKERGFAFGRPEPRDGWSPPELRPPDDAWIMAARRAVSEHEAGRAGMARAAGHAAEEAGADPGQSATDGGGAGRTVLAGPRPAPGAGR